MKKRFFAALLCAMLLITLLPGAAFAAVDVTDAATLATALGSASYSGDTVTLTGNVPLTDTINITSGTIVLELAGFTITGKDGDLGRSGPGLPAITVSGGDLTIRGSGSIIGGHGGEGESIHSNAGALGGSGLSISSGSVTVEGGSVIGGNGGDGADVGSGTASGGAGGSGLSVSGGRVQSRAVASPAATVAALGATVLIWVHPAVMAKRSTAR